MKIEWRKLLVLSLAVALLGVNIKSLADESAESRRLSILSIKGEEAFVARAAGNEIKAVAGTPIAQGNKVRTGAKTTLYVQADNSKIIKLEDNTTAEVTQASSKKLKITLKSGEMFFNVDKPLEEGEELNFDAAQTSMSIRGTSGIIHFEEDKLTFYLIEGTVEWNIGDQVLTIQAGQKVTLKREFNDQLPTGETQDIYLFELIEPFDWRDLSLTELETVLEQQNWVELSAIGLGTQEALEEAARVLGKNFELFSLTSKQKIIKIGGVKTRRSRNRSSGSSRTETTSEESTRKEPTSLASPSDATTKAEETTEKEPSTSETETTPKETTEKEPSTSETETTPKETTEKEPSTSETETTPKETTEKEPSTSETETTPKETTEKEPSTSETETTPKETTEKEPSTSETEPTTTKTEETTTEESKETTTPAETETKPEESSSGKNDSSTESSPSENESTEPPKETYYWLYYKDDINNVTSTEIIKGETPIYDTLTSYKNIQGYFRPLYWVYYQDENDSIAIAKELIEDNEPEKEFPKNLSLNNNNIINEIWGYRRLALYWINYSKNDGFVKSLIEYNERPINDTPTTYTINGVEYQGYLDPNLKLYWVSRNDSNFEFKEKTELTDEEIKEKIKNNDLPSTYSINGKEILGYDCTKLYWINYKVNDNSTVKVTATQMKKDEIEEKLKTGNPSTHRVYSVDSVDKVDGVDVQGYVKNPYYWVEYTNNEQLNSEDLSKLKKLMENGDDISKKIMFKNTTEETLYLKNDIYACYSDNSQEQITKENITDFQEICNYLKLNSQVENKDDKNIIVFKFPELYWVNLKSNNNKTEAELKMIKYSNIGTNKTILETVSPLTFKINNNQTVEGYLDPNLELNLINYDEVNGFSKDTITNQNIQDIIKEKLGNGDFPQFYNINSTGDTGDFLGYLNPNLELKQMSYNDDIENNIVKVQENPMSQADIKKILAINKKADTTVENNNNKTLSYFLEPRYLMEYKQEGNEAKLDKKLITKQENISERLSITIKTKDEGEIKGYLLKNNLYLVYYEDDKTKHNFVSKKSINDVNEILSNESPEVHTVNDEKDSTKSFIGYSRRAPRYKIEYTDTTDENGNQVYGKYKRAEETFDESCTLENETPGIYDVDGKKVLGYIRPLYWIYCTVLNNGSDEGYWIEKETVEVTAITPPKTGSTVTVGSINGAVDSVDMSTIHFYHGTADRQSVYGYKVLIKTP